MFKNLIDILTADCIVIKFSDEQLFYPIFKNGSSSIMTYAEKNNLKIFKNKEISNLKNKITVFIRPPRERFTSGIHTYFYLTGTQLNRDALEKIENFDIINRHFVPQYLWLFHLHKYFDGLVEIRSVDELYNLIPYRDGPWTKNAYPWKSMTQKEKDQILSIKHKKYIDVDLKLIKKYMNKSIDLKKIIKQLKL